MKEENGLYYSAKSIPLSYPEYGNDMFYSVEDKSYWFKHRNNCILEAVKKFCPAGFAFMDVGGGNGFVTKGLQEAGFEAVLIEPGANGVMNAKKRGVKNIVRAALQDTGIKPGSIPAAGLFDVIEHIEDDAAFLKMMNSYMEPGGHLFITAPSYSFLWSDEDVEAGHFRRYNAGSLTKTLNESGFSVEYFTYFFAFLVLPIVLFRVIPYKMGFIKGKKTLKEREREHRIPGALAGRIVEKLLESELKNIEKLKKMDFGSSCLIVAKK